MLDHRTSKTCVGPHAYAWIQSDRLYFVKGNRERFWFSGRYGVCAKTGCGATEFIGEKRAYHRDQVGDPGPDQIMLKEKIPNHA